MGDKLPPEIQCWVDVEEWLQAEAKKYRDSTSWSDDRVPIGLSGVGNAISNLLEGLANNASRKAGDAMRTHHTIVRLKRGGKL